MRLVFANIRIFCQNLILIFYEILKDIICPVLFNIVFLNKLKIFNKIIVLYFIFIKKVYWIDMMILRKTATIFIIINLLFILKKIIGFIIGNPITITITIFAVIVELIKLFGKV